MTDPMLSIDPDDLEPGTSLMGGRFQISARLGQGGTASVYLAYGEHQNEQGRAYALKLIETGEHADNSEQRRFRNEMRLAPLLRKIAGVLAPVEGSAVPELVDRHCIVYDYVRGPTLARFLAANRLTVLHACRLVRNIADTLADLHEHGVVHRDVKPGNIIYSQDGTRPRLIEYGYAWSALTEDTFTPAPGLRFADKRPGTKRYMAPEQALGEHPSPSFDIYALAVTLHEALTGRIPWDGYDDTELLRRKCDPAEPEPTIRSQRRDLPNALAELIDGGLRRDPSKRIPTMESFRDRVAAILSDLGDTLPAITRHRVIATKPGAPHYTTVDDLSWDSHDDDDDFVDDVAASPRPGVEELTPIVADDDLDDDSGIPRGHLVHRRARAVPGYRMTPGDGVVRAVPRPETSFAPVALDPLEPPANASSAASTPPSLLPSSSNTPSRATPDAPSFPTPDTVGEPAPATPAPAEPAPAEPAPAAPPPAAPPPAAPAPAAPAQCVAPAPAEPPPAAPAPAEPPQCVARAPESNETPPPTDAQPSETPKDANADFPEQPTDDESRITTPKFSPSQAAPVTHPPQTMTVRTPSLTSMLHPSGIHAPAAPSRRLGRWLIAGAIVFASAAGFWLARQIPTERDAPENILEASDRRSEELPTKGPPAAVQGLAPASLQASNSAPTPDVAAPSSAPVVVVDELPEPNAPTLGAPSNDAPSNDAPSNGALARDAPTEDAPAEAAISSDAPLGAPPTVPTSGAVRPTTAKQDGRQRANEGPREPRRGGTDGAGPATLAASVRPDPTPAVASAIVSPLPPPPSSRDEDRAAPAVDCDRVRADAQNAWIRRDWGTVLRLVRKQNCWESKAERLRLEVVALDGLKLYHRCIDVGEGSSDLEVLRTVDVCRAKSSP